ncbi:MAG: hypothetical protein ACRC37_00535 [Lentisphaeria bacterium]
MPYVKNPMIRESAMPFSGYGVIKIVSISEHQENAGVDVKSLIEIACRNDLKILQEFLFKLKVEEIMRSEKYFTKLPEVLQVYLRNAPKFFFVKKIKPTKSWLNTP